MRPRMTLPSPEKTWPRWNIDTSVGWRVDVTSLEIPDSRYIDVEQVWLLLFGKVRRTARRIL